MKLHSEPKTSGEARALAEVTSGYSRDSRPNNVRYLGQFGEHILSESFTARDPEQSLAAAISLAEGFQFNPLFRGSHKPSSHQQCP